MSQGLEVYRAAAVDPDVDVAITDLTDEKYEQFVGFESRGALPRAGVRLSL